YAYNPDGRLVSAPDQWGQTYTFSYHIAPSQPKVHGLLSQIKDSQGRAIDFTYYSDGKAYEQKEPGNGYLVFTYSASSSNPYTRLRDLDGRTREYRFDSKQRLIETVHPDGARDAQNCDDRDRI